MGLMALIVEATSNLTGVSPLTGCSCLYVVTPPGAR